MLSLVLLALNMMPPTLATERGHLQEISINSWHSARARSCLLPAGRSAANQLKAAVAIDRWDRQDGHPTIT